MRGSLIFISIFLSHFAFAQFAIVSDKDGFSNIRKAAGSDSKITDTLPRTEYKSIGSSLNLKAEMKKGDTLKDHFLNALSIGGCTTCSAV